MSKFNFKIRKKELSDDEILKHKNFKKLKANYNKATKPLYKVNLTNPKNKYYLLSIIIIAIILYLILTS